MTSIQPATLNTMSLSRPAKDRRRNKRIDMHVDGRFLSNSGEDHTMRTINVSCSGALVEAMQKPEPSSDIVCYFDELGRVSCHVIRQTPTGFAVAFAASQHKRDKLADRLTWLYNKDTLGLKDEREMPRYVTDGPAIVIRANGLKLQCRVIDISLSGASFEADGAPPFVGEIVKAGNINGEVVRRNRSNFAIRFRR